MDRASYTTSWDAIFMSAICIAATVIFWLSVPEPNRMLHAENDASYETVRRWAFGR